MPPNLARRRRDLTQSTRRDNIAVPFWEVVGPWDVDNDNDGVPDSIWVDLGDPIQELEDGTRYKALYAFLIIDLDSRLNVNAHGLAEQLLPPLNDAGQNCAFRSHAHDDPNWPGNLTHNPNNSGGFRTSSLSSARTASATARPRSACRPLFPIPWQRADGTLGHRAINRERQDPVDRLRSTASPRCWRAGSATTGGRSPAGSAS